MPDEPAVLDQEAPPVETGFFDPETVAAMEKFSREKAPEAFDPEAAAAKAAEEAEKKAAAAREGETDEQRSARETAEATAAEEAAKKAREGETDEQKAERERLEAEAKAKKDAEEAARAAADKKDDDLEAAEKELDPHTGKKTRQVVTRFKDEAIAARRERDAVKVQFEEANRRAQEAETKLTTQKAPKELEDRLAALQERVRELDITQDPAIQERFDKRVTANNESILGIMKANGLGEKRDAKGVKTGDSPEEIEAVRKGGFTLGALDKYIKALEKGGNPDDAEAIREIVRENLRIARDKEAEVSKWKGDYEGRVAARTRESQERASQSDKITEQTRNTNVNADLAALTKDFPYLKEPEGPKAGDTAEVTKAKNALVAEYKASYAMVQEAVKAMNPVGAKPEDVPSIIGKIHSNAIIGVIMKTALIPKVLKDMAAANARIKELETELGRRKAAGVVARTHSAAVSAPATGAKAPYSPDVSTRDALADFAKKQGFEVGT